MGVLSLAREFESSLRWSSPEAAEEAHPVKDWADGVSAHWGREKADKVTATARKVLMGWEDWANETFEYPGDETCTLVVSNEPEPEPVSQSGGGDDENGEEDEWAAWSDEDTEKKDGHAEEKDEGLAEKADDRGEASVQEEEQEDWGDSSWGFDEENAKPKNAPSTSKSKERPSREVKKKHSKTDSVVSWTWDDNDDDDNSEKPAQPEKGSRAKGKGKSVEEDKKPKERFAVSTSVKPLLALAEALLNELLRVSDPR
jgi:hypothetical protein